jgi:SMI1 / KNR4 family (SUKH-1)
MNSAYREWCRHSEAAVTACARLGGDARSLSVAGPASDSEVSNVERELGIVLPQSFRRALTEFSSAFRLTWFLPEQVETPFKGIFGGDFGWNLGHLLPLEEERKSWVRECFSNENDPCDRVWHRKLALHPVGNGDYLALDLAQESCPLVYLSHDDGEGHGYVLGTDFESALTQWTKLGCVGSEDWQWLPFVQGAASGLNADCENARRWREWFGLDRYLP